MATIEDLKDQINSFSAQLDHLKNFPDHQKSREDLKDQINALSAQLDHLKNFPDHQKSSKLRIFLEALRNIFIKKEDKFVDFDYRRKITEDYNKEIFIAEKSGKKILHEDKDKEIKIDFNCHSIEISVESILEELKDYRIEIIDNEKIKKEKENIDKRYEKEGRADYVMGTGAVLPEWFISGAWYFFTFLVGPWFLNHILTDLDDAIWQKIKNTILKLYKLVRNKASKENDNFVIVASHKGLNNNNPTILFILEAKLSDKEINGALDKISIVLRETMNLPKKEEKFTYIYNKDKDKWYLEGANQIL